MELSKVTNIAIFLIITFTFVTIASHQGTESETGNKFGDKLRGFKRAVYQNSWENYRHDYGSHRSKEYHNRHHSGYVSRHRDGDDCDDKSNNKDDNSDEDTEVKNENEGENPLSTSTTQHPRTTNIVVPVPRLGTVPYYRYQDDLNVWVDFKNSLGSNAEFVFDGAGYINGIQLRKDVSNIPNFRISGLTQDQDQCCSTIEMFFRNQTLMDVNGFRRGVMQSNTSPQFVRHGICGARGFCRGRCVQQNVNLCLMTQIGGPCHFFQVPGYCACKNFG